MNHGIAHERLAIMDPESGAQPLVSEDGNVIVAANGEIYNYKELYADLANKGLDYKPKTGSDCEVRYRGCFTSSYRVSCLYTKFHHLL